MRYDYGQVLDRRSLDYREVILSETGSFHCEAAGERCGGAWIEVVGGGCIRPDMMNSAGYFLITIFKKQLRRYKNISLSLHCGQSSCLKP